MLFCSRQFYSQNKFDRYETYQLGVVYDDSHKISSVTYSYVPTELTLKSVTQFLFELLCPYITTERLYLFIKEYLNFAWAFCRNCAHCYMCVQLRCINVINHCRTLCLPSVSARFKRLAVFHLGNIRSAENRGCRRNFVKKS